MNRAYYHARVGDLLAASTNEILGELTRHHPHTLEDLQRNAWIDEIKILKNQLQNFPSAMIVLEYSVPRMGKRIDAVILLHGLIFVIEFKVGAETYTADAIVQVMDYALDLKNFHGGSHNKPIVPVLLASKAKKSSVSLIAYDDHVYHVQKVNQNDLFRLIFKAVATIQYPKIEQNEWLSAPYKPTPTIIEAAQALYDGHQVEEITRSDSGHENLSITSNQLVEIIHHSRINQQKSICFVTGVPGAGKTLVGLDVATRNADNEQENAVFLTGNGPLAKVLQEALARDEVTRSIESKSQITKKVALAKVKSFVQVLHHFRDEYLSDQSAPYERVVIFDEAQRAWTKRQTADFMQRKKGVKNFDQSEPEFLIDVMDRHSDWAVIICLIGGGQEINRGEAGLPEWFDAIAKYFPHWHVYSSNRLSETEYLQGKQITDWLKTNYTINDNLHLGISTRSFRAENVSAFVKSLLDSKEEQAKAYYRQFSQNYPIFVTRNLSTARNWLRQKGRGSERYGILASSGAYRLRPDGIHVKTSISVANWFLDDKSDIRSSFALEEAATEFDVQGLELDWICVAWDADLRKTESGWEYWGFRGSKWTRIKKTTNQAYLKNAYRVLLTRARQGIVIFVPKGNTHDKTRLPNFYDPLYEYLRALGIPALD